MQTLWIKALETLVQAIAGRMNYQNIKGLVEQINDSALSGDEKRDLVIDEARAMGVAIASAMLNLLIEVAVNAVRARRAK
ncbi:MAG: hypothetical protein MUC53_08410 [Candidatus Contendobacter sp.]|jgi:hypothetical protein|nr:hypothetical protein [Candidatus Contendobacter sp.]